MPDSGSTNAERALQPLFRKASFFNYLLLLSAIFGFDAWGSTVPNRRNMPDALVPVRFVPAEFNPVGFAPLRLSGVWKVEVADARFGGISAVAVDKDSLVALTDSGTVVRLPRPGPNGAAFLHDLSRGPGDAGFKSSRDSEALARDPAGRGWWVAFENWQQLWLYGGDFRTASTRIDLGRSRWRHNRGVEAIIAGSRTMLLFPESGSSWLELRGSRLSVRQLANRFGSIADATPLADGRLLLVARKAGIGGLAKNLVLAERTSDGAMRLRRLAGLGLGRFDNVEAIAAEPLAGATRLWLMTDNDFRARAPTYLVALDLP